MDGWHDPNAAWLINCDLVVFTNPSHEAMWKPHDCELQCRTARRKAWSQPMGRCVDNGNVDNIIDVWRLEFGMAYDRKELFILMCLNPKVELTHPDPDLQGCCHRGVAKKRASGFGMKNALFTSVFQYLKSTQHTFSTELRDFLWFSIVDGWWWISCNYGYRTLRSS